MEGPVGTPIFQRLIISPSEKYSFRVTGARARRGNHIKFRLAKVHEGKNLGYALIVENTKTDPGKYYDTLYIVTDSNVQPEIRISVAGEITNS